MRLYRNGTTQLWPIDANRIFQVIFAQSLSMKADVIEGRGDIAYVMGSGSYTMPTEGGSFESIKEVGKFLMIFKQQSDGTWQLAVECYNSDLPMPTDQ
jgi:ketosteroid isomerase-like protein